MQVSIVIRTYNEARHIGKLLVGIAAQRLKAREVIVVDSGSTDGTDLIAQRMNAKVLRIDQREFTFGRALNMGCAAAEGDIIVFVSAHVYPTYDTWLEKLVAPFADERVVLSYGRQRGNKINKFSEHQIFEKWFPPSASLPQRGYFCNNANCAIRRTAWASQSYDETLTGLEDLAWAKTAQEAGGWLAYIADAEIVHVHDETWTQVQNRYRREALAMRHIDKDARFSLLDFVRLLAANIAADLCVAFAQGVLTRELNSILRFRYHQMLGTYQGYNGPPELSAELRQRFYYPLPKGSRPSEVVDLEGHRINYEELLGSTTQEESQGTRSEAKIVHLR